jgi:hypothetical protein
VKSRGKKKAMKVKEELLGMWKGKEKGEDKKE